MPLRQTQAKRLYGLIRGMEIHNVVEVGRRRWQIDAPLGAVANFDGLQQRLLDIRKASLDRKSMIVDFDGKPVRVFPDTPGQNINSDVNDIYARGIDSARAVTEILRLVPAGISISRMGDLGIEHPAKRVLVELIERFQRNMAHHESKGDAGLKNAKEELQRFNGALSDLLVRHGIVEQREQANNAIGFVRDFLWKRDLCTASCVLDGNMLRYAEPMTFHGGDSQLWDGEQPWKRKLASSVGAGWLEPFFKAHLADLQRLSPTSMSRFTPNPANAFDCTDFMVSADEVAQMSHHVRTAIAEPLAVGSTKSRLPITIWNHRQLLAKERLEAGVNAFMEKWGALYQEGVIPFTVLHQTLIGDEVTFSPDQQKSKASKLHGSVIDSKETANAAMRTWLAAHQIIRNKADGRIEIYPKSESRPVPDGWQEVKVDLLETNNGINMWSARTRVRNHDVNHARQLIGTAAEVLTRAQPQPPNQDLNTIVRFLNSSDHSFITPYKFRGPAVKEAMVRLTAELRKEDGAFRHLPKETRESLALSMQAAVELKCTVHETWAGSFRRNVDNFTRDYFRKVPVIGHLADWVVRGAMTLVGLGLKLVTGIFSLPQMLKHRGERKSVYKAAYEGILAENLGQLQGGCMSSADRALEMAEQRVAMRKQFAAEGKIVSYNDSQEEKRAFLSTYGRTKTKHDQVEMATGTAGTNDGETRGMVGGDCLMSSLETEAEQKQAKLLAGLRKGDYDETMTTARYQSSLPVGERPRGEVSEYGSDAPKRLKQPLLTAVDYSSSESLSNRSPASSLNDEEERHFKL
ncbi:hypothetical protein [Legionella oakridgensis]|uniref:Uncharacterized protein n=2 Tax=Legionella oakridgensis TaxID=29423 RepID=W0B7S5_9GAMM|nr:hypothetical protein [Legionella oakridgensis]AHE65905.1 hypothetical protein Loa_00316 [Legionella oakridgensis ATCC 33761 = DSM 21215]KTD43759.1 hypothetical protein Loak_0309 [Legionella oakridgensis]STY15836.1 Uncharacterised protein [Legionella longbeachae]